MVKNYTILKATFDAMPMALGGANLQPELRLASFKGALRFWWRVLRWESNEKTKKEIVKNLHAKEASIFGSPDQKVGQSKVRLRLVDPVDPPLKNISDYFKQNSGGLYLGYGIDAAKPKRKLLSDFEFEIELRLSPALDNKQKKEVEEALILMGTLGGLGSASRKGFGSLTLKTLEGGTTQFSGDFSSRSTFLCELMKSQDSPAEPLWTAWSRQTRILTFNRSRDWKDIVNTWGNFLKEEIRSMDRKDRCKMGSPRKSGNCSERRGSPVFFHVSKTENGMQGTIAFFPSLFLEKSHESDSSYFWKPVDDLITKTTVQLKATEVEL